MIPIGHIVNVVPVVPLVPVIPVTVLTPVQFTDFGAVPYPEIIGQGAYGKVW